MRKFNETMINTKVRVHRLGETVIERVMQKLQDNSGNFLEEALKYIIGAVIGILFLGGIYALFKTVIIPSLGTKVQEVFNFTA